MLVKTGFGYYVKDGLKVSKYELPVGNHPLEEGLNFIEVDGKDDLDKIVLDKLPMTPEREKESILARLQKIDLDSIRPLRNGETSKLVELENEAVSLRQQLSSVEDFVKGKI